MGIQFLNGGPQAAQKGRESLHIAYAGDVVQCDRLIGQEAGGEKGQRSVLVPRWAHAALQLGLAFDN